MVKSTENGSPVPPFLMKCYEMVDDQSTDALISWSKTNDSFVIWDSAEFSAVLLPKYFKHSNFSSFIRQLNIYGFRKIDTDRWEFANDGFAKSQRHLLKNINRRKQSQNVVQGKSTQQKDKDVEACEEDKYVGLWKEVENLKTDRNALTQELINPRQHQKISQSKLLLLREQLKGMEKNQQQMLSFIVMAMQSPGFLVQLLQPKENNWRMAEASKNVLKQVSDECESVVPADGMIVRYLPPTEECPEALQAPDLKSDNSLELDLSSDEVRDLFMNIGFMSGPVDKKFLSSDNHGPLILPDLPDGDGMLEQLLLCSPFPENNEHDSENPSDAGMEIDSAVCCTEPKECDKFKLSTQESEKSKDMELETTAHRTHLDNSQNMEILTEQMGLLRSESTLGT